jgi:GAF domain-containing protein
VRWQAALCGLGRLDEADEVYRAIEADAGTGDGGGSGRRTDLRPQQPPPTSGLVVGDATRDGRFATDPSLAGLTGCPLLVVPIVSQGQPRAVLMMENQLRGTRLHQAGFARIALLRPAVRRPGHVAQPCPVILLAHAMNFSGSSFAP